MDIITTRDEKTLDPKVVIEITREDLDTAKFMMDKIGKDVLYIEHNEVSDFVKLVDDLMKENLGEENWKESVKKQAGKKEALSFKQFTEKDFDLE